MSITYTVWYTWDGCSIPEEEETHFSLQFLNNGDLQLQIDAPFFNDPPPASKPGSCWKLWEYEVVEIFLVGEDGQYTELEFAPHGHYLTLRFDAPRSVIAQEEGLEYQAEIVGQRWNGHAIVPKKLLPPSIYRVNCFAIHGQNEERRYLCHWPLPQYEKPDFHQPSRFPLFPKDAL